MKVIDLRVMMCSRLANILEDLAASIFKVEATLLP